MILYNICPATNKVEPKSINNSTSEKYKELIYNDPYGFFTTRKEALKELSKLKNIRS